jgi:hypothetical protein
MKKNIRKSLLIVFAWVAVAIWWLILAAYFQDNTVTALIQNVIKKILLYLSPTLDNKVADAIVNILVIIISAILGIILTCYFTKDFLKKKAKEAFDESIERIGIEAQDQAYYSYLTIVNHTQEMKNLVDKLVKLPRHPELLKVLIEDYSKKANKSKFLVDFSTFLKLAGILVENSEEMHFVNITPPYEWWYPVRFERNEDKRKAIKDYKEKIEAKVSQGKKLERITILEEEKALTSILEYNFKVHFRHYGIDIQTTLRNNFSKIGEIDEIIMKSLLEWFETLLKQQKSGVASPNSQSLVVYNSLLRTLTSHDNTLIKFQKLMNQCWDNTTNDFNHSFLSLSHKLSQLILRDFGKLNNPLENSFYILKNEVSMRKKDEVYNMEKEEGIFKDNSGNMYLLRQEEANGVSVLLVSVKRLEDIEATHFHALMRQFVDATDETNAAGKLTDFIDENYDEEQVQ